MSPTSAAGLRTKVQHFVVSSIVCSSTANKSSPTAVSSPPSLPVKLWHSPTNNTIIDEYERESFHTIQWCCQADKTAILQSQAKALKGVNQEQLALYYGIGRYISQNSREGFWGKDAISTISRQLSIEMPELKGFSPRNLRNMRLFYEEWKCFDTNLADASAKLQPRKELADTSAKKEDGSGMIPLLLEDIPVVAFFSIGFSHFDCRRIQWHRWNRYRRFLFRASYYRTHK